MCGICGIYHYGSEAQVDDRLVARMMDSLIHRGPDDSGSYIDQNIGLGSRRLSIIDLDGGRQPISNEDGTISTVFNGEIYNFHELKQILVGKGHRFKTHTDTEVLVHLYEEYKEACLEKLVGMFALAIWDRKSKTMLLARDRLGVKPLYYLTANGKLYFASEIKAILNALPNEVEIDPAALDAYFAYGYIPRPNTVLRGIHKLPAGHLLMCKNRDLIIKQYWDVHISTNKRKPLHHYVDQLYGLLEESVKLRLVSDVPLGVFLSGGLDSSLVVGMMSKIGHHPIETFSVGFEANGGFNELPFARKVADYFGTNHHEMVVSSREIETHLSDIMVHLDEPVADPALIPTYLVSKLAKNHVTVALSGEGADELFAGYRRYRAEKLMGYYQKMPAAARTFILQTTPDKPAFQKLRKFMDSANLSLASRYESWRTIINRNSKDAIYTSEFKHLVDREVVTENQNGISDVFSHFQNNGHVHPINKLLYVDLKTYLAEDLLTKLDRMSMMVSLEAREPFLDHRIVEFAMSVPIDMKLHRFTSKYILRILAENVLPREILNRPKHGFNMPIRFWLRNDLKRLIMETFSNGKENSGGLPFLNYPLIQKQLTAYFEGKESILNENVLWNLLCFEVWRQRNLC